MEENKKISEIEEGQNFGGEIEDYNQEKKASNFMVKTIEESLVLFFHLDYYRRILDKIERKHFKEEIDKFRSNFILFEHFADRRMIEIFKIFITQTLYQDDYLYHQNETSEYIYFITKGKFIKYVSFSFNWLLEFLDYIKDSTTNAIYHLIKAFPKNQIEQDELIDDLLNKKIKSPMINEQLAIIETLQQKNYEKSVYGIKSEEENINNKNKIFKIKLDIIGIGHTPGIEDALELKNRFYSVKCISEIGEIKKIKISDFLRIIKISKNENNYANAHLLGLIAQKKFWLYNQIIKNAQKLESKLTSDFDTKYNKLIELNEKSNTNKNKCLGIAAIKAKGYKYDIKEIFDKEIPIFPKIKKSLSENYFLQNQLTLKKLSEIPSKKNKRLFKFKNQKRNLTLSLSDPNYCFSEENLNSIFSINKYNSPQSSKRSIMKRLKTELFKYKTNENKNMENTKNEKQIKKQKAESIETLLREKFGNINKKYYLGNEFKKRLDDGKRKFNLIHYKDFFNK